MAGVGGLDGGPGLDEEIEAFVGFDFSEEEDDGGSGGEVEEESGVVLGERGGGDFLVDADGSDMDFGSGDLELGVKIVGDFLGMGDEVGGEAVSESVSEFEEGVRGAIVGEEIVGGVDVAF